MSEKVTAGRDYLGGFAQAMESYKDEEPGDKTPEALFGAGEKLEDTEHFNGPAKNSWFSHVALEDWSKGQPEWLERVSDEQYDGLEAE